MSSDLLKELIDNIELDSIKNDDLQILGDILEESICNNASVLSMLLNNKVNISITNITEYPDIQELVSVLGHGVSAEINFEAGINGSNLLFFKNTIATTFANAVMGAEKATTSTDALGELQLSAFGEMVTQFSSKITTSLTSYLETKIGTLSPTVKQQNGKKLDISSSLSSCPILLITYSLDYGEATPDVLYQVMSINLATDIIEKFKEAKIPNYKAVKSYTEQDKKAQAPQIDAYDNSPVTIQPVKFSSFDNLPHVSGEGKNLDLLMDIKLKLTVELGRTELPIKKVLELSRGSVIELDKVAGEPVELYANGKLIANGEVVVIEDNFGLRITSILSPDHRLKNL